ncbi:capsular polysaccharide biosynthesis protein CapF [uncultured Legionella sp.]|uniref:UDP-2-acetamido-2,6-beta-L-arabino-hexul-4-ose reductase n=1 Tax=uncultured Legionella sp. TaxID=210934 RepID=UPI002601E67E|nr:capsular polysaccharide biosynthesis protein CapF [uncultured Legionella sp.]
MKILITGAEGFIGRNLKAKLMERKDIDIVTFTRANESFELFEMVKEVDFVFHFAGVNRPQELEDFNTVNRDLTQALCEAIKVSNKKIPVLFSSSTQAVLSNPYGISKKSAEEVLSHFAKENNSAVYIYQLPNVFGKWTKPNYNSAVATFCHNIARDLPVQINNPSAEINLVYIDDVVADFINKLDGNEFHNAQFCQVSPIYKTTVGELVSQITAFHDTRTNLITEDVGTGFTRALYSTYVSYLPKERFSYELTKHSDPRGTFVEMLKTKNAGQFSYFTAHPGITRGGHYHHSKTEKFLVITGAACFRFRHIATQEYYEIITNGDKPEIVETVPGWTHDITNIGDTEMIVMLWANEIFDRDHPDTYACEI